MKKAFGIVLAIATGACGDAAMSDRETVASTSAALDAVTGFGSNPGNLAMYRYTPAGMPANAPLVVALHGCTQSAAAFASNGLNALADKYKFYVVYPQQNTANNPVSCFDWWGAYNNPADKSNITRGKGENLSVKQMVDKTATDFSVDRSRVFVVGFSAGAAMAAVMLATWPDVFAAGAIDAGIPYDCPSTANADVFNCMSPGKTMAAADWAQRVKQAYPGYTGRYPRVSIWQGTQDHTVAVANTTELVKQWTAVHGLTTTPTATDMVDGYPHSVFADASHVVRVESYAITGMDHGFAVDPARGCGTAGAYVIDKGICTARHIVDFFGVTGAAPADAGASGGDSGATVGDAGTSPPGAHDGGSLAPGADGGDLGESPAPDGSAFANHAHAGCGVARGAEDDSAWLLVLAGLALASRRRRAVKP